MRDDGTRISLALGLDLGILGFGRRESVWGSLMGEGSLFLSRGFRDSCFDNVCASRRNWMLSSFVQWRGRARNLAFHCFRTLQEGQSTQHNGFS